MNKKFNLPTVRDRLTFTTSQNYALTLLTQSLAHNGLQPIYETKHTMHNLNADDFDTEEDFQKAVEELSVTTYEKNFVVGDTNYIADCEPVYAAFSMKAHGTEIRLLTSAIVARRQVDVLGEEKKKVIGQADDPVTNPFVLVAVDKVNFIHLMVMPSRNELIEEAKKKAEASDKEFTTFDRMAAYSKQLTPINGKEPRYITVEHRAANELEKAGLATGDLSYSSLAHDAMHELMMRFFEKYTINDDNLI